MTDISSTGVVLVLAALGVVVLALIAMLFPRKPKRAEKWEKAEIMKQLLALSEREESLRRPAPTVRVRASATARNAVRPATSALKATTKTAMPVRSKAR
jgi:Na+-translocating ferredoxin:NAD+ oxidoreductase RnfG subunit